MHYQITNFLDMDNGSNQVLTYSKMIPVFSQFLKHNQYFVTLSTTIFSGESGRKIKRTVSVVYFMMSRFLGYWKKYIITRSEAFHKVCVQEKRVYSDGKYAHGLFVSDWKMSTVHISPYLLNTEFPFIMTKTLPL